MTWLLPNRLWDCSWKPYLNMHYYSCINIVLSVARMRQIKLFFTRVLIDVLVNVNYLNWQEVGVFWFRSWRSICLIFLCFSIHFFFFFVNIKEKAYFFFKLTELLHYEVHMINFQTFFVWALLLIVHTWNSSPLRSNLLRLQCTYCNVPTTSGTPHRSPLVWPCQWSSSLPLSSPQWSHNDSLWA